MILKGWEKSDKIKYIWRNVGVWIAYNWNSSNFQKSATDISSMQNYFTKCYIQLQVPPDSIFHPIQRYTEWSSYANHEWVSGGHCLIFPCFVKLCPLNTESIPFLFPSVFYHNVICYVHCLSFITCFLWPLFQTSSLLAKQKHLIVDPLIFFRIFPARHIHILISCLIFTNFILRMFEILVYWR